MEIYRPEPPSQEEGVEIPLEQLDAETLARIIESFILREGTDYGESEVPLARKIEQIKAQLSKGEVKLVFDLASETCNLVRKK